MYLALQSAHQNTSAGSKYMHLRSMMSEQAVDTKDVGKLLGRMDNLRNKLRNICPDGSVTINNVYISSVISALPEAWSSVTAPLELQHLFTVAQLNNVLRGHIVKLKNCDSHLQQSTSVTTSLAASNTYGSSSKKAKPGTMPRFSSRTPPTAGESPSSCDHCGFWGHLVNRCWTKQIDELRKEIDHLNINNKGKNHHCTAKATAPGSDSDTEDSV